MSSLGFSAKNCAFKPKTFQYENRWKNLKFAMGSFFNY